MMDHYTEAELIEAIAPLTHERLMSYLHLRIVQPAHTDEGLRFLEIDLRRVTLLCELTDDLDLDEDALVIVMGLLDQLHGARGRIAAVMGALSNENEEVQSRIARALTESIQDSGSALQGFDGVTALADQSLKADLWPFLNRGCLRKSAPAHLAACCLQ